MKKIFDNSGVFVLEIVKVLAILFLAAIAIKYFVFQTFVVVGSSMEPTFHDKDLLVVNEISYRFSAPKRGDVIVFRFPKDESKDYIKRIIGIPGDAVQVENGIVKVNDKALPENYITVHQTFGSQTKILGEGEYYVLGDNRDPNASSDSREWGPVPRENIIGKVWFRLFPNRATFPRPDYGLWQTLDVINK